MTLSITSHNTGMLNVIMLDVIYAECRNLKAHYAKCHYAECHHAECHYAEYHYAECRYAECRGATYRAPLIILSVPLNSAAVLLEPKSCSLSTKSFLKWVTVQGPLTIM
jgi:hypothetical protein